MAEEISHPSKYVKLTKDQAPFEDNSEPGELIQPIDVPQLHVRKCNNCRQPLPEGYQVHKDEPWTTGIFHCAEDPESCKTGLFCPCVLFGRNVEQVREGVTWTRPCICHAVFVEGGLTVAAATAALHGFIEPRTTFLICEALVYSWWICGLYSSIIRQLLQKKYHLKNSPCNSFLVHCCLHWCALCQEHREMKARLSDGTVMSTTIMKPPPVQKMNDAGEGQGSASTSGNGIDLAHVEMQSL